MTAVEKILVVRLSSIGDIILTTPLLRSLKKTFPQARITFVIKKQYAELLAYSPYVDELITFNQHEGFGHLKDLKRKLKEQRFDLYLDIHKNWRSRYLRFGLGAKKITSYNKLIFKRTMLIWFKINLYRRIKPVYERYFDSVKNMGIQYDGHGTQIQVSADKINMVRNILSETGFSFNKPLVVICPGATYFNKRWLHEGFIETAKQLIMANSVFLVFHGGPEDRERCKSMAKVVGNGAVSLAGTMSLAESAALLSLSNVVIANDSGLMHLAQSQKVPVVGIYGPTTRELGYFPIAENSSVVETGIKCRPCTHNGLDYCPKDHFKCMKDISPETVIQAALKYLP